MTCGGNLGASSGMRMKLAWPGLLKTKLQQTFGRAATVLNECTGSLLWRGLCRSCPRSYHRGPMC